eukprot:UN02040
MAPRLHKNRDLGKRKFGSTAQTRATSNMTHRHRRVVKKICGKVKKMGAEDLHVNNFFIPKIAESHRADIRREQIAKIEAKNRAHQENSLDAHAEAGLFHAQVQSAVVDAQAFNRIVYQDVSTTVRHAMTAAFSEKVALNRAKLYTQHVKSIITNKITNNIAKKAFDNFKQNTNARVFAATTMAKHAIRSPLTAMAARGYSTQASASSAKKVGVNKQQKRKFTAAALPPHEVLAMPALSPTMEIGKISSWEKKVGDKVNAGDVLCQVETDKATVSFDSTEDGYIAKILVEAGAGDVPVGKPVAILVEDEDMVAKFLNYEAGVTPSAAAAAPTVSHDVKKAVDDAAAADSKRPCGVYIAPESPKAVTFEANNNINGRIMASPLARVIAQEKNVDLTKVKGTGMYGAVTKNDVLAAPTTEKVVEAVQKIEQAAVNAAAAAPAAAAAKNNQQHLHNNLHLMLMVIMLMNH